MEDFVRKTFNIKTLPNWVFAVLIAAFCWDDAQNEALFVHFWVWLALLTALNVYVTVQKNAQGEWEWTQEERYRCGFAVVSAAIIAGLRQGFSAEDASVLFWLLVYAGVNWAWAYGVKKYLARQNDWQQHYLSAYQQSDFAPQRIVINSHSERQQKWQVVGVCVAMMVLGLWLAGVKNSEYVSVADKWVDAITTLFMLGFVLLQCKERNNLLKALRLLEDTEGEYLDISSQGLAWQVLLNQSQGKWQQLMNPQFVLDTQTIAWPQLKSVTVLADDDNAAHPITYLLIQAKHEHALKPLTLRIDEKQTNHTSQQLRQLLLQYHNLGMKPFHTVV